MRTPDSRFADLQDYDFEPHYVDIDGLRMHYVDEGPIDGEVIVLLHGEPSWSYLYRSMIPPLAANGFRVVAPDLIGMGRSDKPVDIAVHSYEQHVAWLGAFFDAMVLELPTVAVHDWGGVIGLRVLAERIDSVGRIVQFNSQLPIIPPGSNPFVLPESTDVDCTLGAFEPSDFQAWIEYALRAPDLTPSEIVEAGTVVDLSPAIAAGYDAPYPSFIYKAAIRAFPSMITAVEDQNQAAWDALGTFTNPLLTLWGATAVPLTGNEFNVLSWLVTRPGRAVSRRQLLDRALGLQSDALERTVDSHVSRVRKKLGEAGAAAIVTVWGIGWRFEPPEDP